MRAKTLQAPKDFREELRKLNQMKQKLGKQRMMRDNKDKDGGLDDDDDQEIEAEQAHEARDVITVSTLGLNNPKGAIDSKQDDSSKHDVSRQNADETTNSIVQL